MDLGYPSAFVQSLEPYDNDRTVVCKVDSNATEKAGIHSVHLLAYRAACS